MGKKMKITSLFRNSNQETRLQPRQYWRPPCNHPKTLSFRAGDDIFKTLNSVFFDSSTTKGTNAVETPETWFTNSSAAESARSLSTESEDLFDDKSLEMVVRGARSERLFFEPGDTSSILEEAKTGSLPFKESVVLAMDSEDPYVDFRRSMEEMVGTHGLKDWDCLEELLGWYLRANGKKNHGFIVDAFVDMLLSLAANSCSDSTSYSSAISSFSSSSLSPLCSLEGHEIEIDEEENMAFS